MKAVEELKYLVRCKAAFQSVAEAKRAYGLSRKMARIITGQPGYQSGNNMVIRQARDGSVRLYVQVAGTYMDASLHDMMDDALDADGGHS